MPEFVLDLFGGPRLRGPGGMVTLSPYQQYALLVAGAPAGPTGVSRAHLGWLLWEEDPTPAARQRLRQLLHGIRRRAGRDLFAEAPDGHIRLDPSLVRSDVELVADHLGTGRLHEAARLVVRGFGSALSDHPSREFADWMDGYQTATARALREAAARAWDAARPLPDWPRARDAAEAAHLLAPDEEPILRMVIEARGATGSLQGAEAAFSMYCDRLPGERRPDARTVELVERVRSLQATLEEADQESALPLVGREESLADLRRTVQRVRDGRFEIVVIRGEAGMGKSRLLRELAPEARLAGVRPLYARAVEPEQRIPLNTLLDALGEADAVRHTQALGEPWRTLVAAFLPADAAVDRLDAVPPIQEGSVSRRLLDAFTILLGSVAAEQPILLCIDDLQWVDDTSLAVFRFAQRRWGEGRIGIVGTIRPSDVPGRDAPSGALADFLRATTSTVDLAELDEASARRLIHAAAGRTLDAELADRIEALGGRNPFYLIELTRDHLAGRLANPRVPSETVTLPIPLQELFDRRFNRLGRLPQRVAELLTVLARPVPLGELATLTDLPPDECALAVDQLVDSRLVRIDRGVVTIRHQLFRSAFYRRITPARVAMLHERIAEHLLRGASPPSAGELAVHFSRAGRAAEAAGYGRAAADVAVENGAASEAAYFLELVVENEADEHERARATGDLAQLLHANRQMARAAPLLEVASDRLRRVGRPDRAMRMSVRRVDSRAEVEGIPLAASVARLAEIKEEARTRQDWEAVAVALDTELHLLHQAGDVDAIHALFEQVRECATKDDPAAACLAHSSLALNILFGDPDEALSSAREAVRLAEEEGQKEHLLMAQTRLVVVFYYRGRLNLPEGRDLLQRARLNARTSGHRGLRVMLETNVGAFLIDIGATEEAEAVLSAVAREFQTIEARVAKFNFYVNWGEAAYRRGEIQAAKDRFLLAAEADRPRLPAYMWSVLEAHIGLCALAEGDLPTARQLADQIQPIEPCPGYDPTPIIEFFAASCERRREDARALAFARQATTGLENRLLLPWIKAKVIEARLSYRLGERPDDSVAAAYELAVTLRLGSIAERFRRYLALN